MTTLSNAEGRAELEKLAGKKKKGQPPDSPKKSKMGNEPTEYNGRTYQSKKEVTRAKQLDWKLKLGKIKAWTPQVPYRLEIKGVLICTYVLDFQIEHNDGSFTYEDAKGRKAGGPYQMFKLKQKLMKVLHGIDVVEV